MAPVEALLQVASHPDDGICSMSFSFWHRLSVHLTSSFSSGRKSRNNSQVGCLSSPLLLPGILVNPCQRPYQASCTALIFGAWQLSILCTAAKGSRRSTSCRCQGLTCSAIVSNCPQFNHDSELLWVQVDLLWPESTTPCAPSLLTTCHANGHRSLAPQEPAV